MTHLKCVAVSVFAETLPSSCIILLFCWDVSWCHWSWRNIVHCWVLYHQKPKTWKCISTINHLYCLASLNGGLSNSNRQILYGMPLSPIFTLRLTLVMFSTDSWRSFVSVIWCWAGSTQILYQRYLLWLEIRLMGALRVAHYTWSFD